MSMGKKHFILLWVICNVELSLFEGGTVYEMIGIGETGEAT